MIMSTDTFRASNSRAMAWADKPLAIHSAIIGARALARASAAARQGLNCRSPKLMDEDFAAFGEIVEIVRPLLHHATPLGKVLSVIVCSAHVVALVMRKLAFDPIGMEPHFV